jgi:hypothetical protein
MKKKLFKELTKSIKQAGKIKRARDFKKEGTDVYKADGYYVFWSEKIVIPDGIGPRVRIEWEQHISGPHSLFVAKEILENLKIRINGEYVKNILFLHLADLDKLSKQTEALESIYKATTSPLLSSSTHDDHIRMTQACIKDCRRISKEALKI